MSSRHWQSWRHRVITAALRGSPSAQTARKVSPTHQMAGSNTTIRIWALHPKLTGDTPSSVTTGISPYVRKVARSLTTLPLSRIALRPPPRESGFRVYVSVTPSPSLPVQNRYHTKVAISSSSAKASSGDSPRVRASPIRPISTSNEGVRERSLPP